MLKSKLLEVEGKINYQYLQSIASPLPKPLTQEEFLAQFGTGKARTHIETPIKELEIEPAKAWEHLVSNSKEQDRQRISGALLEVLQKPLFITKDTKGTFYFYKPYKDEKGVLNLVSITIPKSNRIRYKTSYIASRERMLKMINEYELVYESF